MGFYFAYLLIDNMKESACMQLISYYNHAHGLVQLCTCAVWTRPHLLIVDLPISIIYFYVCIQNGLGDMR